MKTLTRRTWVIAIVGLVSTFVIYLPSLLRLGPPISARLASDVGGPLIVGASAVVTIAIALAFPQGEPSRWHWGFIGFGALAYALGDVIWGYSELVSGAAAFPGAADVLYLEVYALMGAGLIGAARSFRWLANIKSAAIMSYSAAGVVSVMLYFILLNQIIADPDISWVAKTLSVLYPLGDLLLLAAPAVTLVIALRHFSVRAATWPWLLAALGALLLAMVDATYVYSDWQGTYVSGSAMDIGWGISYVLLAVAASVARDVFLLTHPTAR